MKTYSAFFLLLCAACIVLCTSCFDIVEDVSLKANGSGSIKATANLSKSKTKVASLMKLDKVDGVKVPTQPEIRKQMADIVAILKKTPGISNVQQSLDFQQYIATLSCDFTNVEALNAFTSTLSKHFETDLGSYSTYSYQPKTGIFERKSTYQSSARKKLEQLSPQSKASFNDAFYSAIYRFEVPVKQVSNQKAQIASNKRAIMLKVPALQVMEGKINLSNKVQLSN